MACIDFSFDSRIRKKYVPLVNQQRYLRHVKRIAARNLNIPEAFLNTLPKKDSPGTFGTNYESGDEDEEETILYSKLNIGFYFTIHDCSEESCRTDQSCCNCGRLLYRSELIMSTNPSWKGFDGSTLCSPSISRFVVSIYFVQLDIFDSEPYVRLIQSPSEPFRKSHRKNPSVDRFHPKLAQANNIFRMATANKDDGSEIGTLFLRWDINLTGLLYIGEEFPKDRRLTKNSIIFGFAEGFYTSVCSVASETLLTHSQPPSESIQILEPSLVRNSYCLNTLIRIQMVQCIIHSTAAKVQQERLALEAELERIKSKQELLSKIEKLKESNEFLESILQKRRQKSEECKKKIADIKDKLLEHNMYMSSQIQVLKEESCHLNELRSMKLVEISRKLEHTRDMIARHRKLLARRLFNDIYNIVPFPDGVGYAINGVHLPSSEKFDHQQHKMLSIGLGYVAHLVYLLSMILDIFLFHQIIPYGSRSSIFDLFNKALKSNEKMVPLYLKSKSNLNVIFFRHGWFLLNRLIVFLRQCLGVCTEDFALTLGNLYSLYRNRFLPDENLIEQDNSLNRFNPYSPSMEAPVRDRSSNFTNQNQQAYINDIKIDDFMLDCLWKEVELMTLNSYKADPSSSQTPLPQCLVDEIKETIAKQRHQRRIMSSERLSQLTSSLPFAQASSSFELLTPNIRLSALSSGTLPQDIASRHRRISLTQCSFGSYGPGLEESNNSSLHRMNGQYSFQQFNTMRRIRSVSTGYGTQSPQSLPTNHSFLYPRGLLEPTTNSTLSISLDNGLNRTTEADQGQLIHSKSSTSSTVNVEQLPFLNLEMPNFESSSSDVLEKSFQTSDSNTHQLVEDQEQKL